MAAAVLAACPVAVLGAEQICTARRTGGRATGAVGALGAWGAIVAFVNQINADALLLDDLEPVATRDDLLGLGNDMARDDREPA